MKTGHFEMQLEDRDDFGHLLSELDLTGYGIELGVAGGEFSHKILEKSKLKILFSVDRWSDHHNDAEYKRAAEILREHGERSAILRLTFDEALLLFQDEVFDFIYIDGYAHTGQCEGKTIYDWWPKLKAGGIFAGHDYSAKFPKTIEHVDRFVAEHNLELHLSQEKQRHRIYPSWFCAKQVI